MSVGVDPLIEVSRGGWGAASGRMLPEFATQHVILDGFDVDTGVAAGTECAGQLALPVGFQPEAILLERATLNVAAADKIIASLNEDRQQYRTLMRRVGGTLSIFAGGLAAFIVTSGSLESNLAEKIAVPPLAAGIYIAEGVIFSHLVKKKMELK